MLTSFEAATGLPLWIGYVFVFAVGSAVGSFLNVVIYRVPREMSIVFPNSKCPACDTPIKPYDNLPLLGWLLLRGKCRACGEGISVRYPAVELLTALLWCLAFWQVGWSPMLPVAFVFVSVTVALMFIDAEHMILPNVITYPFFLFAVAVRLVFPLVFAADHFADMSAAPFTELQEYPRWLLSLGAAGLGALVGGGSLWLVGEAWKRLRGVDAMGLGDVKMMLGFGALLGWRGAALAIFIAAFTGAVVGMIAVALQKDKNMQTQIPFGIFLGIGSVVAFFFGERMIAWYIEMFIP
jgi:leader peptidase (prepilin peptidase) / N-methyltransferase